jgi:serine phosphatase RsbU (regulator of sigma subunit)
VTRAPRHAAGDGLLARLWPVVDPALDVLPAQELIDAALTALCEAFELPAAALQLVDGERHGPGPDDPVWEAGPRLVLPVYIGTEQLGRLEIAVAGGAVSPDERLAYQLAATRLGRAVARRRYEAMQDQARDRLRADAIVIERLYRAAGALMAEHELEQVVQYVTEEATALARAQFGAFFYNVLDDRGEAYTLYTIAGVPRSEFDRFPMPRNTLVFAPTFTGEAVVRSDDITADPRYGKSPPYHGMPEGHLPVRSYLAAPVLARDGEVLGGLFFGHEEVAVFDSDAERLVVGLAALAALAIENARLHDTAQRELEASRRAYRERDHVARVLQESLLPPELPRPAGIDVAARYAAGEGIAGGDFYDLFPVAGDEWVAAIGDVQGKGPSAAARTSLVRHAVRLAAFRSSGPAAILDIVNRAVLQDQETQEHRFSTLLVARVLQRDGAARVAVGSGGHPPALVLRRDGSVESVDGRGTLLGVVADLGVVETAVALAAGDAIVLYTDGLTEARRGGALLGEERVREILRGLAGRDADSIAAALEQASAEWSEGPRRDDLALLVLRVA